MTEGKEEILLETADRFSIFPIKYQDAFDMYKKHVASFWEVAEIDLASDYAEFSKLSDDEKHFILRVLAFFASADGIVNENLAARFLAEVQVPEVRQFYAFQIAMEAIHAETYALLIDTYVKNVDEKRLLFSSIEKVPSIQKKADWAIKWLKDSNSSFAERLVAFACVEGILFSGSFCAIFYFKKRGLLKGLTFSNELISRDEGLHRDFACLVYRTMIKGKLTEEKVRQIVGEAVQSEEEFIKDALKADIIGMNSKSMMQYIRFVADHLLSSLGHQKMYGDSNPYDWMELISLQGKTNFFEKRVGEYQKANVILQANREFTTDEDF